MKIKKEWVSWEELERYALSGIGGSFYTKTEINAMWEGYSGTKGQVAWANVTGKPGTFTPSAHASAHQADGDDPLSNPLLLGASPVVNWQSGSLLLQTDEGTDTPTVVEIKGKGAGVSYLRLFDKDKAEYLEFLGYNSRGYITVAGSSPGELRLQHNQPQSIKCWPSITAGNPYLYRYGYQTGVGVKYGRDWVDASGIYNLQGEVGLKLNWPSYYADNSFLVANNKVADSDQVDGEHAADIVTDARVKAHFPDTIANILSDHDKAAHDALGLSHDSLADVSVDDHHAQDHAARHQSGGADAIKLDDFAEPDDVSDLNSSISRHGLLKKLCNDYQQFLGGTGLWTKLVSTTGIAVYVLSKASTNLRNSNDAEKTTAVGSYTKVKEVKLGDPTGKMKIEFTLESVGGETVYGKLYKNGSPVGTEHSTTTVGTWAEDLGGFNDQDLIQIYAYATLEDTVKVRNMRFKYDRAITAFGDWPIAVADYITTDDQTAFSMQSQDP